MSVSVVIPTHPARVENGMLERAVRSVEAQTRLPDNLIIEYDNHGEGAAVTRDRGLRAVRDEWVTFLDSDDELLPPHIEHLLACAADTRADIVYPWYQTSGYTDPFPWVFGKPWDPAAPCITTIVILCRTSLAQEIGFLGEGETIGEDWRFMIKANEMGARIVHLPERTWIWHHHGKNTSGQPDRGDAR